MPASRGKLCVPWATQSRGQLPISPTFGVSLLNLLGAQGSSSLLRPTGRRSFLPQVLELSFQLLFIKTWPSAGQVAMAALSSAIEAPFLFRSQFSVMFGGSLCKHGDRQLWLASTSHLVACLQDTTLVVCVYIEAVRAVVGLKS